MALPECIQVFGPRIHVPWVFYRIKVTIVRDQDPYNLEDEQSSEDSIDVKQEDQSSNESLNEISVEKEHHDPAVFEDEWNGCQDSSNEDGEDGSLADTNDKQANLHHGHSENQCSDADDEREEGQNDSDYSDTNDSTKGGSVEVEIVKGPSKHHRINAEEKSKNDEASSAG